MRKSNKVADLTVEELKDIIRQIIKEEVPVLTTVNTYVQKEYPDNYRTYYDTKTTPYEEIKRMHKCEASNFTYKSEASDVIK